MGTLFSIIIILASILLILVVYIQNPKGGGLSSDFGAAQQIGGVQKTNDFIDKATWSLAGVIAVLSIILTLRTKSPEPIQVDPTPTEQDQTAPVTPK
jgi:preprotein translocase subunit SecG